MRMFFGRISTATSGGRRSRRQRFRSGTASARLAFCWPMMNLSSSATIWRGVSSAGFSAVAVSATSPGIRKVISQLFDSNLVVRVDVDRRGDAQRLARDLPRGHLRELEHRLRGRKRVGSSGADGEDPLVGRDQVARARDQEREVFVGDDQEGFELAQDLVGPPVASELDGGSLEVAAVFVELRLEFREERERVGGGA